LSDGFNYQSVLWVQSPANFNQCTLTGPAAGRFEKQVLPFGTVDAQFYYVRSTNNQPLLSDFLQLTCQSPVFASVSYSLFSPSGQLESMATVFSALPVQFARLPIMRNVGAFAVALVNPGATDLTITVTWLGSDTRRVAKQIVLPAGGHLAQFIDQLLDLDGQANSGILVVSDLETGNFYLTELLYVGERFTTLIPAT
jgi:hypothetical protein